MDLMQTFSEKYKKAEPPKVEVGDTVRVHIKVCLLYTSLWKHRANFMRLIHGKESKLTFHKKKEGV